MEKEQNPNIELKQRALQFALELTSIYFEERDCSRLLSFMQPHTSWIGTGEDELVCNLQEAGLALSREMKEYSGKFRLGETCYKAEVLSDTFCVVYGQLNARPDDAHFYI